MASNPYVNKVQLADGTSLIDISDTTAVASDVASGKYFYLPTGQKVQGNASGGASNIVQGSFTSSSSSTGITTVTIPYTGNGYPIEFMICIDGGSTSNSTSNRYAICCASGIKRVTANAMTYNGTANNDGFSVQCVYKGSSATSYSTGGSGAATIGHQNNPQASTSLFVSISAKNTFKFFTKSSSYGLFPGKKYNYTIVYSS